MLGLMALPLALYLFRNLPDRGYAFSKAIGLLVLGYLLWLSGSLGVLSNTRTSIFVLLGLMAVASGLLFLRRRQEFLLSLRRLLPYVLAAEVLFAALFAGLALLRAYTPGIYHTEQPMDFAFLNATYRSRTFPPVDPWLSGHSISYYYFGYLLSATVSKLTGIAPASAYNLSLAMFFALSGVGAFGLVFNLVRWLKSSWRGAIASGVAAAFLLLVASNLEGALEMAYARGWGSPRFWESLGISGLNAPYSSTEWFPTGNWWWWRATRILDGGNSISEFPFFSFMLGDMHPHVMALPFALVALGMGFNIFSEPSPLRLRSHLILLAALAWLLGGLAFINTWDFPTYLAISLGLIGLQCYSIPLKKGQGFPLRRFLFFAGLLLAGSVGLYLPYYLSARGLFAQGVLPVVTQGSSMFHLLLIWGLFLFVCLSFLGTQVGGLRREGELGWRRFLFASLPFLALLALWLAMAGVYIAVEDKGGASDLVRKTGQVAPWLALLALLLLLLRVRARRAREGKGDDSSLLASGLIFVAFLIIAGVELFFVLDVFGSRMNTVFKLYYQAWTLLALASAFGLYYVGRVWARPPGRWARGLWWGGVAILAAASLVYTAAAPWGKTGAFSGRPTLNGLSQLEAWEPERFKAIQWLNSNVEGTPVIVTAPNDEWNYSTILVSSATGLPTPLGWPDHERQWRGSYALFQDRRQDIETLYQTRDAGQASALLDKYAVSYVYVGPTERQKYPAESLAKFDALLEVAYSGPGVTIYRVRRG